MEPRHLGSTGIEIPPIGFGCGGNARLMVEDDEQLRLDTIRAAIEGGINYFDTARAYGDGRSEVNLGRALRVLGADPVISTKISLQDEDLADPRSAVLREFDAGMKRLQRTSVDALMLHNRVFEAPAPGKYAIGARLATGHIFGPNGVAAAFDELRAAGRIRAGGFTAYGGDTSAIRLMIESGSFGAMNASFSALNPTALIRTESPAEGENWRAIGIEAAAHGLGIMAIQILARGVLATVAPDSGAAASRPAQVAGALARYDESVPRAAIRYVLGKSEISTVIVGFSSPAHVADAITAVNAGPLSSAASASIESIALAQASTSASTGQPAPH